MKIGDRDIRQISDAGDPMLVDPATVGCGFLLFPVQMSKVLQEDHVNQALETNKPKLWAEVRRLNPNIPTHLMTSNQDIGPADAVAAIEKMGRYPGHSVALDCMQLSPDGGRTLVNIYVGFSYRIDCQEIVVAGPHMILPGKPPAQQREASVNVKARPPARNNDAKP
jgi:hypothetical protein